METMNDNTCGLEARTDEFGAASAGSGTIEERDSAAKAMGNGSMIFYKDWFDAIKNLPREVRGEVLTAIIEYGLYGVTTGSLKPVTKAMLDMVKGRIDLNRARFSNGKKGGRPAKDREAQKRNVYYQKETSINKKPTENQTVTIPEPNPNQNETKTEPNLNQPETIPEPNPNHTIYNNIILSPKVDNISSFSDEKEASTPAHTRKEDLLPLKRVKDMWNETCVSYPQLLKLSDARKNKIRIRLQEMGGGEKGMEVMKEIFRRLEDSSFLRGNNKRGWKATFDWVFENDKNWVKVWEGNYDMCAVRDPSPSARADTVNDIWNDGTD